MKNQTLQSLAVIYKRIQNSRGDKISFHEILEINKTEINFLADKFDLKGEEAVLLAGSCIYTIDRNSPEFDIDDLANSLDVSNFEILLHQKYLKSLVEKKILLELPKDRKYRDGSLQFAVDVMNKEFALHTSLSEHLA